MEPGIMEHIYIELFLLLLIRRHVTCGLDLLQYFVRPIFPFYLFTLNFFDIIFKEESCLLNSWLQLAGGSGDTL